MGVSVAGLLIMSAACSRDASINQLSTNWEAHCCLDGQAVLCKSMAGRRLPQLVLKVLWRRLLCNTRDMGVPASLANSSSSHEASEQVAWACLQLKACSCLHELYSKGPLRFSQPLQRLTNRLGMPTGTLLHWQKATQ